MDMQRVIDWPQGVWRDGKELEICTAGLEFESGRAPLVRVWNNKSIYILMPLKKL
jgi:hypothetical protein